VQLFIERFSRGSGKPVTAIRPEALQRLMEFHWPGNVRELENVIERACAMAKGSVLELEDIRLEPARPRPALESGALLPEGFTLEQWEDELIREALRRTAGNKSRAARMLGLSRNALRYRLSRMGIADEPEKES